MSLFDQLADIPFVVEQIGFTGLDRETAVQQRLTTVIELHGSGHTGKGEDVTYQAELHPLLQSTGSSFPLTGHWTIDSFSRQLGELDLFVDTEVPFDVYRNYRRWGFESAALDLALRQANISLADALGRTPHPVKFVASPRLSDPPTFTSIRTRLDQYPGLKFKLDATPGWTTELIDSLHETRAVDVVDFKGAYRGTPVDVETDPELYRKVAEGLPDAILEDPDLEPAAANEALLPYKDRIAWDAPIHSVDDIEALPFSVRFMNIKPSRFGSLRELLNGYEFCEQHRIRMYGGGQSELGIGREQIQYLASLFHPDAPNDVAPAGFDWKQPPAGLPTSPLPAEIGSTGFRRSS